MKKSKVSAIQIFLLLTMLFALFVLAYQVLKQQTKDAELRSHASTLSTKSAMIVAALHQNVSSSGYNAKIELLADYIGDYDETLFLMEALSNGNEVRTIRNKWASIKPQLVKIVRSSKKLKELGFLDIKIQSEIISMGSTAQRLLEAMSSNKSKKLENGIRIISLTNNIAAITLSTAKRMSQSELTEYSDSFNSFDATLQSAIIGLSQDIKKSLVINSSAVHSNAVKVAEKRDLVSALSRNRIALIEDEIEISGYISIVLAEAKGWLANHEVLSASVNKTPDNKHLSVNNVIYASIALSLITAIVFIYGQIKLTSVSNSALDENMSFKQLTENKSKYILEMLDMLKKMEEGELNLELKEGSDPLGQIGNAVNKVIASLRQVVAESRTIAQKIEETSGVVTKNTEKLKEEKLEQTREIGSIASTSAFIKDSLRAISDASNVTISASNEVQNRIGNTNKNAYESIKLASEVTENQQRMASKTKSTIEMIQTLREKAIEVGAISQEIRLVGVNLDLISAEADGAIEKRIRACSDKISSFSLNVKDYTSKVEEAANKVCLEAQETQRAIDGSIEATSGMIQASDVIMKDVENLKELTLNVADSAENVNREVSDVEIETGKIVNNVKSVGSTAEQHYSDARKTAEMIDALKANGSRIIKITDKFTT
jgi:methyl-accepting chemotaxis protein